MADQKARRLAPHVQAAIAAGRGVGVQGKMGSVGGKPEAGRGAGDLRLMSPALVVPTNIGESGAHGFQAGHARAESVRGVAQRKEAPHVRDMSKQALGAGRVGQSKVAHHEVGKQRKEAPHVQRMLGSVSAAGRLGQAKTVLTDQPGRRERAAHVREVPSREQVPASTAQPSGRPVRRDYGRPKVLAAAVQRKEREAEVVWQVTHLVKVQNESLFGGESWQTNELPANIGQLTRGQKIHVDDEDVFMSRRGANQERPERRKADADRELTNKWLGVREVGGKKLEEGDVYIRAETIRYTQKEHRQIKPIDVQVTEEPDELLFENLKGIKKAWIKTGKKRRRSVAQVGSKESIEGTGLTSGWNWDQYDEGKYVAGEMIKKEYREKSYKRRQWTLTASYHEEKGGPIAYMILEERGKEHGEEEGTMYLRWLVGHPEKGGGGNAVMTEAIKIFKSSGCKKLKVESAYSAVDWYKSKGFEVDEEGAYELKKGYGDTVLSIKK